MDFDFFKPESKQIMVNNIKFTIYNNTNNDIYHLVLKKLNYTHIAMNNQLTQLKNIITQRIFDKCKNDINFKYKVFYFLNTMWKDKYCSKFPILKTLCGDDLIIKYLTLIKNNTNQQYTELTYGSLIELNEISHYFKVNIVIVTTILTNINNNFTRTIYLYKENDKYYTCKKEDAPKQDIFSFTGLY